MDTKLGGACEEQTGRDVVWIERTYGICLKCGIDNGWL
jgi:hypothetical protein